MNKTTRAQEKEYTRQSMQKFFAKYPDEESCLRVFPADCKACGTHNEEAVERGQRVFDCTNCSIKTWRTAGTFFHGLQYLHPTFALIWAHEDRAVLNAFWLSKMFGIVYATAWETVARVKIVLEAEMRKHDVFHLMTGAFNPVICKRSNLCSGGQHPSYEEPDNQPDPKLLEGLDADQLSVCAVLNGKPTGFDRLFEMSGLSIDKFSAALSNLDIMGIAKQHSGHKYSLLSPSPTLMLSSKELALLDEFFEYIKNFHGISRRYLQRYIASFWARYWCARWVEPSFLECCMKYGSLSQLSRKQYNSPKLISIPTF